MTKLEQIIRARDKLSKSDFDSMVVEASDMFNEGIDPEEIMYNVFGIEPDYLFDLLELLEQIS